MDDSVVQLSRRSTEDLVEKLTNQARGDTPGLAKWYTAGADFCFYAPAQEACATSHDRLRKLDLRGEDARLLETPVQPDRLVDRLFEIQTQLETDPVRKSAALKRTSKFVNSFAAFATKTSSIVMVLVPQSPEYTVTFGMLFLLFKAVVTKKDREESLLSHLEAISHTLPIARFYETVFPTNAMKGAVARLYSHIMKVLDEALVYYRDWRWKRLVDAVLQPNFKFTEYIKNVETEIKTINELKEAGHIAETRDMKDIVSGTGQLVARMYENFEYQSRAIGTSMEIINSKVDMLTLQTGFMLNFEMIKHVRCLQEILLPDGLDAQDELEAVVDRGFHLSLKDHWENNGVLEYIMAWSAEGRNGLLWVGGSSGNQDSWVTEMATDLVQALQPHFDMVPLFVFCDLERDAGPLTPLSLLRRLLVQLLDLRPQLAYRNPELCNAWRFQVASGFRQIWKVFESLASKVHGLFILIDLIDECVVDEKADLMHNLLPALMRLAREYDEISVIVTSRSESPAALEGLPHYSCWIDTSSRRRIPGI